MNILIVVDKLSSAIGILSQNIVYDLPHHEINVVELHPKRPNQRQWDQLLSKAKKADVIHWQYWRSAELARETHPELKEKPSLLTHHNPYDLDKEMWINKGYNKVIVKNNHQKDRLPYATKIPHTINGQFFAFTNDKDFSEFDVGMVASRIESSKGILEVAEACKRCEIRFTLVGRISDRNYFRQIKEANPHTIFKENIDDPSLVGFYKSMSLIVVNSKDGFESGPLPVLEAMAAGTPVMSRPVGLVNDIDNGKNLYLRKEPKEDVDSLVESLKWLKNHPEQLKGYMIEGFNTVKTRLSMYSSLMYEQVYYNLYAHTPLVSVIVPTKNRPKNLVDIIAALALQSYQNIEVLICDDSDNSDTFKLVREMIDNIGMPIKYYHCARIDPDYGLARARNTGILNSVGTYCMFIDDRIQPNGDAIEKFVNMLEIEKLKTWVWGMKDGVSKGFVENFSMVRRRDIVNAGGFNERIDVYGGMTEDIKNRCGKLGYKFLFNKDAKADSISKSSGWKSRPRQLVAAKLKVFKLHKLV